MYQLEQFAEWTREHGIVHGFTTREDGNQGFGLAEPDDEVIRNRTAAAAKVSPRFDIGLGVSLVPFQPGREEEIVILGKDAAGQGMTERLTGPAGEAMVLPLADLRGAFFLFLATADCYPIILFDPVGRALGLVHAGRESTIRKMITKTISRMGAVCGTQLEDLYVAIGPGIRQANYEVARMERLNADPEWVPFLDSGSAPGSFKLDLLDFNRMLLRTVGIESNQIAVAPFDTFTSPQFFSHRWSKATGEPEGRHACIVGIAPPA